MKHVLIFQHRLLHYRVEFFEFLRAIAATKNIRIELVHGQASPREQTRKDVGQIEWGTFVRNRFISLKHADLLWQDSPKAARDADMLILMQENRIISNYPYLFRLRARNARIAYWGHGANFQSRNPRGLRERWKRYLISRVDWWFAYTSTTVELLEDSGFDPDRITCVNNAINTTRFRDLVLNISAHEIQEQRREFGIPANARIGVFCGSLYPDKRLDLLLSAADKIRRRQPSFHLAILGDGPSMEMITDTIRSRPWIHPLGVQQGREKALWFRMADVMLNPGSLGLHILDSFSAGVPLVSTLNARHGPEIAYVENGVNSILTEDSAESYAEAVDDILTNDEVRERLSKAALAAGSQLTLDQMADRFMDGIVRCLASDRNRT